MPAHSAMLAFVLLVLAGGVLGGRSPRQAQQAWDPKTGQINGRPMVIAHRGASGYFPEHTLAAYREAINMGADCIECDIVVTKDLKLVCRHDLYLQLTTDAEQKFPRLNRTYSYPEAGGDVTGIFALDLTLEQIKSLRAKQGFEFRDQSKNGQYQLVTLEEYVRVATDPKNKKTVCIIPEVKHPTFQNRHPVLIKAGVTIDQLVIRELQRLGYNLQAPLNSKEWLKRPIYLQSFEQNNLRYWHKQTKVPLVQLVGGLPAVDTGNTPEYLTSEKGIKEIAQYATNYAPWKGLLVVTDNNKIASINDKPVQLAHKYGMSYTVWTLRNEPQYLVENYQGNQYNEFALFFNALKANAGFSDHPDNLVAYIAAGDYKKPASMENFRANAETPSWDKAPRCDTPQVKLVKDTQGNLWGWSNGMSCAYAHTVELRPA